MDHYKMLSAKVLRIVLRAKIEFSNEIASAIIYKSRFYLFV